MGTSGHANPCDDLAMTVFLAPPTPLSDGPTELRPLARATDIYIDPVVSAMGDIDLAAWLAHRSGNQPTDARALVGEWVEGWKRGTNATFGVVADDRLIAVISAVVADDPEVAELGIWVHQDTRRRGLATAAVKLLADWCFRSGIERVWIEIDPDNDASHALARSVGFVHEGVLRSHCGDRRTNQRHDCVFYSLLPSDS